MRRGRKEGCGGEAGVTGDLHDAWAFEGPIIQKNPHAPTRTYGSIAMLTLAWSIFNIWDAALYVHTAGRMVRERGGRS